MTIHWLSFLFGAPVWGTLALLVFGALLASDDAAIEADVGHHAGGEVDTPRVISLADYRIKRDREHAARYAGR
jgi:hypothetical protein